MRMDSNSDDSQDDASTDGGLERGDRRGDSDNKIMAYLLKGFAMMSAECKTCSTPLIKNIQVLPEESGWFGKKKHEVGKPVNFVPFCVACESIVVTSNDELQVMWKDEYKHLMATKGAVTLAIEVVSKEDLLAVARAQERNFADEDEEEEVEERVTKAPTRKTTSPIAKYENSDGLLVVAKDDDEALVAAAMEDTSLERRHALDDVEVELDESTEELDFELIAYKKRRQIATKILGAKMIQGYSLRETQCTKCNMPLMEKPNAPELECVVCPVLIKKVQKKMAESREAEQKKKDEEHSQQMKAEMKQKAESALREELQRQLDEEQGYLGEVQATRKAATDLDEAEQQIMDEIKKARERRIDEENQLLAEEKHRQLRVHDDERNRLIEELHIAREERNADMKRQAEEKAAAEERTSYDKILEIKRQEERKQLIEDLRIAREQKGMEDKFLIHEAKEATQRQREAERLLELKAKEHDDAMREAERLLELKSKEHDDIMAEFKKAEELIKEDSKRREEELRKADVRAKEAEDKLSNWRESTDNERRVAEGMLKDAEEKFLDAEEALIEAEEMALEAQNARDMGFGDRSRLVEMYRNAELLRIDAESEESTARIQLQEANRRLENVDRMQLITENRLTGAMRAAHGDLEKTKNKGFNDARQNQQRLKAAENQMLQARFGSENNVGAAGEDWEARRLLGKKVLAKQVMSGWTVMPEYCTGRMCNFTPLISKGNFVECVVCEGCGNGKDGFYNESSSDAVLDDTMSFVSKRNRFSRISNGRHSGFDQGDRKRDNASREVGRRMLEGWQLCESPCPSCRMPLMSEAFGTPEICVFCDPDENVDYGNNDDDNISVSSRQSVTIEIPEGFDPSDPNAMAALVAKATSSIKGGRGRPSPAPRNRIPSQIGGGRQRSVSRPRSRIPTGPPIGAPRMRSQSPGPRSGPRLTPESRNSIPTNRGHSRNRGRSSRTPGQPVDVVGFNGYDDDDASQLSDDVSVARSVASHTLDAILSKIDSCKAQLNAPDDGDDASIAQKRGAADLIQKLAQAAAAVKQLEASSE